MDSYYGTHPDMIGDDETNPDDKVLVEIVVCGHRDGGWIVQQSGNPGLWRTERRYTSKIAAVAAISLLMDEVR